MLGTPHIFAWHRRHDAEWVHPRSLVSAKTMAEFDPSPDADPHANGTIWGAALWGSRMRLTARESDGAHRADLLVLKSLLLVGKLVAARDQMAVQDVFKIRERFSTNLCALLHADRLLFAGAYHDIIRQSFRNRGIEPDPIDTFDWERKIGRSIRYTQAET
jgi:hypothetical protein